MSFVLYSPKSIFQHIKELDCIREKRTVERDSFMKNNRLNNYDLFVAFFKGKTA